MKSETIVVRGVSYQAITTDKGLTHPQMVGRLIRFSVFGGKQLWKHSQSN